MARIVADQPKWSIYGLLSPSGEGIPRASFTPLHTASPSERGRTNLALTEHVLGMSEQIQPSVLTEDQAAEYLQLPVRTLQMWRYRKEGPAYFKLGHAVRYRVEHLEEWLAEHLVVPSSKGEAGSAA